MFANLVQLITGRPAPADVVQHAFIAEVHIHHRPRRDARVERIILACWILIAVKHVLIIWACAHYPVPFHPLWVNFPTWMLGALATGIYYGRLWRA